ncbi:MAG TPA: hypothetical protein VGZ27_03470 [Vicinamibacterales bacterium]|jgi:hypothetical protein|nr:hypothetical protein [Vicinamibacterales bacterium]
MDTTERREGNPLGVIVALGLAGLLLVLLFFRSSPKSDVPLEQGTMAAALVDKMMTNGVLVNYDCSQTKAWVNRAVWDKYNSEQRRNMTIALATACDTQHAGYRISVIDYDAKREIASFDGKSLALDK